MKKIIKNLIKFCIFISIGLLPFITMTQLVGMEIFIDSFENSEYYVCLQDENDEFKLGISDGDFVIIQRSSHPDFKISNGDSVIYYGNDGDLICNKFSHFNVEAIKRDTVTDNEAHRQPIHESLIIGKVINVIDGNIWNSISISMWETSISSLNLGAFLSSD